MRWMRVVAACVILSPLAIAGCRGSSPAGEQADRAPETLSRRLAQTNGTIKVPDLKD